MRYITYIFWVIVIVLIAIFASLNSQTLAINYYFSTFKIYLPLLLLIVLVIGAILGISAMLPWLFRSRIQANRLRRKVKKADKAAGKTDE